MAEDICFQEKPSFSGISESYEPGPGELLEGLVCGESAKNQSEHVSEPGYRPLGGLLGVGWGSTFKKARRMLHTDHRPSDGSWQARGCGGFSVGSARCSAPGRLASGEGSCHALLLLLS